MRVRQCGGTEAAGAVSVELASGLEHARSAANGPGFRAAEEMGSQVDVDGIPKELMVFLRRDARGHSVSRVETHGGCAEDRRQLDGLAAENELGRPWAAVRALSVSVAAVCTDELVEELWHGVVRLP